MSTTLYDLLGTLLRYPDAAYPAAVEACRGALAGADAETAAHVERFAAAVRGQRMADLEEFFTHTFDINPVCSLEVGWHLFGEDYERGAFLVRMRQELRRYGLAESSELPDHLTHGLAVLGRMEPDQAGDFAATCVLPAVDKMVAGLSGRDSPYEHALRAIQAFLVARHGSARAEIRPHGVRCGVPPRASGLDLAASLDGRE